MRDIRNRDVFSFATLSKTSIALAVAQAMLMNVSSAATITVTNGGDNGAGCTFREATLSINAGVLEAGCSNTGVAFGTNDRVFLPTILALFH